MGGRGGAVLRQEHQREWFDDLVEAQAKLRVIARYCSADLFDRVRHTALVLDSHVDRLVSGQRFDEKDFSNWRVLRYCIAEVTDCSRLDGGEKEIGSGRATDEEMRQRISMAEAYDKEETPNIRMWT